MASSALFMEQEVGTAAQDLAKNVFQVHAIASRWRSAAPTQAAPRKGDPVLSGAAHLSGRHGSLRIGASLGARANRDRPQGALNAANLG